MNVFFELNERVVESARTGRMRFGLSNATLLQAEDAAHTHLALYDTGLESKICRQILILADRVWVEDEDHVRFFKHRSLGKHPLGELNDEDRQEFLWIKLKSIPIHEATE